jgi:hypothetical protein
MAIESYKKYLMEYVKTIRVSSNKITPFGSTAKRQCLFNIVEGNSVIGSIRLDTNKAILESKQMGSHGAIKYPAQEQLIERLTLDTPKISKNRIIPKKGN